MTWTVSKVSQAKIFFEAAVNHPQATDGFLSAILYTIKYINYIYLSHMIWIWWLQQVELLSWADVVVSFSAVLTTAVASLSRWSFTLIIFTVIGQVPCKNILFLKLTNKDIILQMINAFKGKNWHFFSSLINF